MLCDLVALSFDLHDCPVVAMVTYWPYISVNCSSILYVCYGVMSVHPEGGGSARDTRVSLNSVDVVSRLAKCCWRYIKSPGCTGSSRRFDSDLH